MPHTFHQILTRYWGYSTFRPLQEDIIMSVFNGHDTLALLPTGGGKSVCFQVPALAMDGICIVISPLIALMKDQVHQLQTRGIKAAAIFSGMARREMDIVLDNCVYGDIKFLYVSPERLKTDLFTERLKKMKVCLIAVDESHCISQWGYDFRPPYLEIAEVRQWVPKVPVLALTATATPKVVKDIQEKLKFRAENVFQKSFERKNLIYAVIKKESKEEALVDLIQRINGSGIVYVRSRQKTKDIADRLIKHGIRADYYHAGIDQRIRDKKQQAWMDNQTRVIVSTNAFGMGIDKPNVRFVIHVDIPDCIESYFQEAGRAGRDEQRANAIILYNDADTIQSQRNFDMSFPDTDFIKRVYNALGNYFQLAAGSGEGQSFDFSIGHFAEQYKMPPGMVFSSLKFLEKEGLIILTEAVYEPSRIFIPLTKDQLYKFQVANAYYDNFIKLILRSYGGVFDNYVRIDEADLARKTKLQEDEILKLLQKLDQMRIISYKPSKNKPQIIYVCERLDPAQLRISPEIYGILRQRAEEKLNAMLSYVTAGNKCRSQLLLDYFGEKDARRCGACDVCRKRNEIDANELEFNTVIEKLKPLLRQQAMEVKDIVKLVREIPEEKIQSVIRWLIDQKKVEYTSPTTIKWKQ